MINNLFFIFFTTEEQQGDNSNSGVQKLLTKLAIIYRFILCCVGLSFSWLIQSSIIVSALLVGSAAYMLDLFMAGIAFTMSLCLFFVQRTRANNSYPIILQRIRGKKSLSSIFYTHLMDFLIEAQDKISGKDRRMAATDYIPFKIFFAPSDFFISFLRVMGFSQTVTPNDRTLGVTDKPDTQGQNMRLEITNAREKLQSASQELREEQDRHKKFLQDYYTKENYPVLLLKFINVTPDGFLNLCWREQLLFFAGVTSELLQYSAGWAEEIAYSTHSTADIKKVQENRLTLYNVLRSSLLHSSEVSVDETILALQELDSSYKGFSEKIDGVLKIKALNLKPAIKNNLLQIPQLQTGLVPLAGFNISPVIETFIPKIPFLNNFQNNHQIFLTDPSMKYCTLKHAMCPTKNAILLRTSIERTISVLMVRGLSFGFIKALCSLGKPDSVSACAPYAFCIAVYGLSTMIQSSSLNINQLTNVSKPVMFFLPDDVRRADVVRLASVWKLCLIGAMILSEGVMHRARGCVNVRLADALLNTITLYHIASVISKSNNQTRTSTYFCHNKDFSDDLLMTGMLILAHFINERSKSIDSIIAGFSMFFMLVTFWAPSAMLFSQVDRYIASIKNKRERLFPGAGTEESIELPTISQLCMMSGYQQQLQYVRRLRV